MCFAVNMNGGISRSEYICNVVKFLQKILIHFVLLLIVIAVQQTVDSSNVVNWIQKIVLHCAVLLIVIGVQQSG